MVGDAILLFAPIFDFQFVDLSHLPPVEDGAIARTTKIEIPLLIPYLQLKLVKQDKNSSLQAFSRHGSLFTDR